MAKTSKVDMTEEARSWRVRMAAQDFVNKMVDSSRMTPQEYEHLVKRVLKALPLSLRPSKHIMNFESD